MIKSVKVLLKDKNSIIKRLGIDKNGSATEHFRDLCDKYMDSYVPMDSGALKNNKSYPSNHEIEYNSPYAHYMYNRISCHLNLRLHILHYSCFLFLLSVSLICLCNCQFYNPRFTPP